MNSALLQPAQNTFRWRIAKRGKHIVTYCTILASFNAMVLSTSALANPQGGQVVSGSATIATQPNHVQVDQTTDRAVINWDSFNIGAGETARFNQPTANSLTLNRVTNDSQASVISGALQANGGVLLLNPNGVVISNTGRVDTGSFVATTANINDADFNKGNLRFATPGKAGAAVVNNGTITVKEGGLAALVAPTAQNNGVIEGRLAKVQVGAADTFAVDLYGDGLVNLEISDTNTPRKLTAENNGKIIADGGSVLVTTATASGVVDGVVNNTGVIQARSLENRNGTIILTAGNGDVNVSGSLDVSGKKGGGKVLIGGDYQGTGTTAKARNVNVKQGTVIKADATENGNGGTVILWSEDTTVFNGDISAQGGYLGGNGGFVETSGKLNLGIETGSVITLAPNGTVGTWLLDPTTINIVAGNGAAPNCATESIGCGYDASAHNNAGTSGTANIRVGSINTAVANVILAASQDINIKTNIAMANDGIGLIATAGRDINATNNNTINTNNGVVTLSAGRNISLTNNAVVSTGTGNITLNATNDVALTGANVTGGTIMVTGKNVNSTNGTKILATAVGAGVTLTATGTASGSKVSLTSTTVEGNGGAVAISGRGITATNTSKITTTGTGDVTLTATDDGISLTSTEVKSGGNAIFNAGKGELKFTNNTSATTTDGTIVGSGRDVKLENNTKLTTTGASATIDLTATNDVSLTSAEVKGGGTITVTGGKNITATNSSRLMAWVPV